MVWSSPFVVVRLDNLLLQNRIPEKGAEVSHVPRIDYQNLF